jgi:hypothetical protein
VLNTYVILIGSTEIFALYFWTSTNSTLIVEFIRDANTKQRKQIGGRGKKNGMVSLRDTGFGAAVL